jgi:hypothetical protein
MGRKSKIEESQDFDFGNIEIPEFNPDVFNFLGDIDTTEENRYTKPKVYTVNQNFILYENAEKLARELTLNKGERSDVFVAGSFIFGDFIEAYIVSHNAKVKKMTVTTLSLSQENVDSLHNLIAGNFVDELNLIVSVYFYGNEFRSLIPYIYRELDMDDKFQLAVIGTHTKTCTFETLGGRKIIIHGSANLRSSGNLEQFTIEENETLYDFYDEHTDRILNEYKTINKPIRGKNLWNTITRKQFND